MYHLYPRLLQALVLGYSHAEPPEANVLLRTIAAEIASDDNLFETVLIALVRASQQNNQHLLCELRRHLAADPRTLVDVPLAFQRWQSEDALLRPLAEQAFGYLFARPDGDKLLEPDQDQFSLLPQHLWSDHE